MRSLIISVLHAQGARSSQQLSTNIFQDASIAHFVLHTREAYKYDCILFVSWLLARRSLFSAAN